MCCEFTTPPKPLTKRPEARFLNDPAHDKPQKRLLRIRNTLRRTKKPVLRTIFKRSCPRRHDLRSCFCHLLSCHFRTSVIFCHLLSSSVIFCHALFWLLSCFCHLLSCFFFSSAHYLLVCTSTTHKNSYKMPSGEFTIQTRTSGPNDLERLKQTTVFNTIIFL